MTTNIERYIDHLFYNKGSITLEGVGTISLERIPAVITPNHKEILPPKSVFHFSENETNPHQLVELIMENEGVSGEHAHNLIGEYTRDILHKLTNYNIVKISDIGYLEKNNEKIVFTASQQSLDQIYFGLPVLPLNPISKGSVSNTGSILVATDTIEGERNNEWLNYLGALLLGASMILAYHYFVEPFPYIINDNDDTAVSTEVLDQVVEADASKKKMASTTENLPLKESEPAKSIKPLETDAIVTKGEDSSNVFLAKPSSDTECVIIIGVFTRTINALELSDRLKEDGYTPYLEDINDTQRVGIAFKCANHDLQAMITNIRKRYNKKAWYLVPQISI